jgi:hypothetical protein
MARDYKGNALGKGRVIWTQPPREYGPYMKVQLDATGMTVIVPMRTSNRLVKAK